MNKIYKVTITKERNSSTPYCFFWDIEVFRTNSVTNVYSEVSVDTVKLFQKALEKDFLVAQRYTKELFRRGRYVEQEHIEPYHLSISLFYVRREELSFVQY
ncbi:MAG: hypothetical protein ACTSQA_07980 [Candidatus Heimdallarchaeaceae archaeon]